MKALKLVERLVVQISCSEFENRLDDLLEGELDSAAQHECEEHMRTCECCAKMHQELKEVSDVASSLLSTPIPDEVRLRLRAKLSEETGVKFSRIKPRLTLVD